MVHLTMPRTESGAANRILMKRLDKWCEFCNKPATMSQTRRISIRR